MKKIVFLLLSLSMIGSIGTPAVAVAAESEQLSMQEQVLNRENSLKEFSEMQDQITSILSEIDGHYSYDKSAVKEIVYKFDFEKLNKNTEITFTKETFYDIAISNIENTNLKPVNHTKNGNQYNRNHFESGWNYGRLWMDTSSTKQKIHELTGASKAVGALKEGGGVITGGSIGALIAEFITGPVLPIISGILTIEFIYAEWYFDNVAENLGYKNNGTGTILEVNKFTTHYNCWSQDEY